MHIIRLFNHENIESKGNAKRKSNTVLYKYYFLFSVSSSNTDWRDIQFILRRFAPTDFVIILDGSDSATLEGFELGRNASLVRYIIIIHIL